MALVSCPDCGNKISSSANRCPKCGNREFVVYTGEEYTAKCAKCGGKGYWVDWVDSTGGPPRRIEGQCVDCTNGTATYYIYKDIRTGSRYETSWYQGDKISYFPMTHH